MNDLELAMIAVCAPMSVALLLLLARPLRTTGPLAAGLSVFAALSSFVASLVLLFRCMNHNLSRSAWQWVWLEANNEPMATIGIQLDGISTLMLVVVSTVALCVQVFSLEYMSDESSRGFGRYFTWQSLFLFAMQGLVVAPNLLQLFFCWELVGLCSYLLIGFYYQKPSAARAALKAFWMTKFADMGLLIGLVLQFSVCGTFGWDPASVQGLAASGWALPWVAGLYFLAVMGKSAQFPLHVWLPDAMEGPTPVSALLHAATMVAAGVYLMVRSFPIFEAAETVMVLITYTGATTAIMAACIATVQTDIKKVLAYSTCSQLGYMVAALGAGSVMAGYFHLTTHAFFKALLFLGAGSIIHAVHTNDMREMGGLFSKMRFTSTVFIIGSIALAGLPIFSGFYSKDLILETLYARAIAQPVYFAPFLACVLAAGLTGYYMTRAIMMTFFGTLSEKSSHAHEHGWQISAPLVLLAILAVTAGFGATGFAHLIGDAHYHFHIFHPSPVALLALGMSTSGIAVGYLIHGRGGAASIGYALVPVANFIHWGPINRAWLASYKGGILAFSASVAWFDRYVVDGLVNLTGAITIIGGNRLRMMQTGRVNDYIYVVVFGAILLAAWGQLWLGAGAS